MTSLSRRQAALLACLLDADGALVDYATLGCAVGAAGVNESAVVRRYVSRLECLGVGCVDVVYGRGCRMVGLPPDWALEYVLLALDAQRRDGYVIPILTWGRAS